MSRNKLEINKNTNDSSNNTRAKNNYRKTIKQKQNVPNQSKLSALLKSMDEASDSEDDSDNNNYKSKGSESDSGSNIMGSMMGNISKSPSKNLLELFNNNEINNFINIEEEVLFGNDTYILDSILLRIGNKSIVGFRCDGEKYVYNNFSSTYDNTCSVIKFDPCRPHVELAAILKVITRSLPCGPIPLY